VVDTDVDAAAHDRADDEACLAAARAARRILAHHGVRDGVQVTLHRMIPAHHGLGSGTQLALATARAINQLFDLPGVAADLAQAVGRAQRSAIGTYVFELGGFILEGGRRSGSDALAPLLSRLPIPPDWRCVLAVPMGEPGVSGEAEAAAFAALPVPPTRDAEQVAHLTLLGLLPALVESDFAAFGDALTQIQRINGGWFAAAQGGRYARGRSGALAQTLIAWGATGVGQSSWGPAIYALAPDPDASAILAGRLRAAFPDIVVYDSPFSPSGATIREERGGAAGANI
jgi:beta-ribofuranosylaminobenzene 5'-phosphate synthase